MPALAQATPTSARSAIDLNKVSGRSCAVVMVMVMVMVMVVMVVIVAVIIEPVDLILICHDRACGATLL